MGKNYNGTQISQSVTVSEVAGATVEDCRNKIFVYDENGKQSWPLEEQSRSSAWL